jgi:hypothetical protein
MTWRTRIQRGLLPGGRRGTPVVVAALIVLALVGTALALGSRIGGPGVQNGGPAATGSMLPTPAGTGVVARLPIGPGATFSWSPDGAHLLVSDESGSRVYDRFGRPISEFPSVQGWLDASHLIDGNGRVAGIGHSQADTSPAGSEVLASGHGSAAVFVARGPCAGDPTVKWYRDGRYLRDEQVTPFGWSTDGQLALVGHMSCDATGGAGLSPRGNVQLVDVASGRVVATLPAVRGEMAFSPGGDSLAAQSDSNLEVADVDTGNLDMIPGVRFLGWLDDETIMAARNSRIELIDLDPLDVSSVAYAVWQAESPTGLHLAADLTGAARAILASDGTALMDLSSAGLVAERYPSANEPVVTALQPSWWSPDGAMLALESADGTSLALLSVDPSKPAAVPDSSR